MAHNLTFNSVTGLWEVMTVGAAWHELGQVVEGAKTWKETIELAGLNWRVGKKQLQYNGIDVAAWGLFRDDQPEIDKSFITPTTETYEPIQNEFMFAFLDTMIENDGGAHYEAAGSLNGGAQVFALVNIGKAFEIGNTGDRHENYLLFTDDRTAKRSAKCFMTTVRVVCANTLEQALSGQGDAAVTFRHTKNVADKMVQALNMFSGARMTVDTLHVKLERLAERKMTKDTLIAVIDRLFPTKSDKESVRRDNKVMEILRLYEDNDANMFPEVRGTAYNLLNALTQYTDHFVPVRRTTGKMTLTDNQIRAERALVGDGVGFKQQALDIILEETSHNPIKGRTQVFDAATEPSVDELFADDSIDE